MSLSRDLEDIATNVDALEAEIDEYRDQVKNKNEIIEELELKIIDLEEALEAITEVHNALLLEKEPEKNVKLFLF